MSIKRKERDCYLVARLEPTEYGEPNSSDYLEALRGLSELEGVNFELVEDVVYEAGGQEFGTFYEALCVEYGHEHRDMPEGVYSYSGVNPRSGRKDEKEFVSFEDLMVFVYRHRRDEQQVISGPISEAEFEFFYKVASDDNV